MIKYLEMYRDYLFVNKGVSKNTVNSYLKDIKQYFTLIKDNDIDSYIEYLYSNKYKPRSLNRKISALKSYYNFLLLYNFTDNNPFMNFDFAKIEKYIPDSISYKDILSMLDHLETNLLDKAIIEVLYGCGLRVSELVNLKISDIYYEESIIKCRGKGNKERIVPINKKALLAINEYKTNFRDKIENSKSTSALFINKKGKQIYRQYVNNLLNKIEKQLCLNKHLHPHLFRHTFSTHLLENGANLRIIQTMLGHKNIMTSEIYTHVNEEKIINDYNKYFKE